jgi:hypothetical protein
MTQRKEHLEQQNTCSQSVGQSYLFLPLAMIGRQVGRCRCTHSIHEEEEESPAKRRNKNTHRFISLNTIFLSLCLSLSLSLSFLTPAYQEPLQRNPRLSPTLYPYTRRRTLGTVHTSSCRAQPQHQHQHLSSSIWEPTPVSCYSATLGQEVIKRKRNRRSTTTMNTNTMTTYL